MELLKRGCFETTCEHLTIEAIQAKVVVFASLLGDAHNLALFLLGNVGEEGILTRLEVTSRLQSTLGVNQMTFSEAKYLFVGTALGRHNDSKGVDNVGNGAVWMSTNLFERVFLPIVGD